MGKVQLHVSNLVSVSGLVPATCKTVLFDKPLGSAMSRLNLAFVLAVALLAVAAHAQIYTYSIKYTYYNTATCAATPTGMIEFENGTCGVLNPGASSAVSCSETGGASGNTCMGTTCNDTCSFVDYSGSTWDQVNCMINSASSAQGITCIRTLVPAAPVYVPFQHYSPINPKF